MVLLIIIITITLIIIAILMKTTNRLFWEKVIKIFNPVISVILLLKGSIEKRLTLFFAYFF